jgi:outer membrane lipoprotein-sorting protein
MKILLTFFLLVFSFFFSAYSQNISNVQDPAAEPYLNSLSKLFDPQKAFQVEFKYEVESKAEGTKVNDYGSVIIKGQKYKLNLEDGEMYYNGEKLWVYNKAAGEVYSSFPKGDNIDQMILDPFRLLSKYKEYYKYRLKDDVMITEKQYVHLELYPKNLETSYSILRIYINKKNGELFSLELQQKNGVFYRIYVSEIINPIKMDDSAFSWNASAHPDVLEIEM